MLISLAEDRNWNDLKNKDWINYFSNAAQNRYQLKLCSTLLMLYWLLSLVKSQKPIQALGSIFRQTEKKV